MIVSFYTREKLISYATKAGYKKIKDFLLHNNHYVVLTIYEKSDLRDIMSNLSRLMKFYDVKDVIYNLDKKRTVDIFLWKNKEELLSYEIRISEEKSVG